MKPRKIKAKISRTVVEIATVILDRHGDIVEIVDIHDELEFDDVEVITTIEVFDTHSW